MYDIARKANSSVMFAVAVNLHFVFMWFMKMKIHFTVLVTDALTEMREYQWISAESSICASEFTQWKISEAYQYLGAPDGLICVMYILNNC